MRGTLFWKPHFVLLDFCSNFLVGVSTHFVGFSFEQTDKENLRFGREYLRHCEEVNVMSSLPTIGVVTTSTNAISRGYYSVLAAIDSWGKIADQIVIVDGGTTDATYDTLKDWTEYRDYKVLHSPETYWDLHGRFHLAQWGINTRIGMEHLETDWAVIIPGDHVLDVPTAKNLRQELAHHKNTTALKFKRHRYRYGDHVTTDYKFYFLNLRKIRSERLNVAWGLDKVTNHTPDDPIVYDSETRFVDAVNGAEKRHLAGVTLSIPAQLESLSCWSYGFYFFTKNQGLSHLKDFHLCCNVRYFGRPPQTEAWHMEREHLDKIQGFIGRDEELKKHHVPEIRKLIENYYRPDMIGAAVYQQLNPVPIQKYLKIIQRSFHYAQTLRFMCSGFPSVIKNQKWSALNEKNTLLNLRGLYEEQDAFLRHKYRSKEIAAVASTHK